jgi:hypothetical protein
VNERNYAAQDIRNSLSQNVSLFEVFVANWYQSLNSQLRIVTDKINHLLFAYGLRIRCGISSTYNCLTYYITSSQHQRKWSAPSGMPSYGVPIFQPDRNLSCSVPCISCNTALSLFKLLSEVPIASESNAANDKKNIEDDIGRKVVLKWHSNYSVSRLPYATTFR